VKREMTRGLDDWEQRLSTALVKTSPTDLVRTTSSPSDATTRPATESAQKKTS